MQRTIGTKDLQGNGSRVWDRAPRRHIAHHSTHQSDEAIKKIKTGIVSWHELGRGGWGEDRTGEDGSGPASETVRKSVAAPVSKAIIGEKDDNKPAAFINFLQVKSIIHPKIVDTTKPSSSVYFYHSKWGRGQGGGIGQCR